MLGTRFARLTLDHPLPLHVGDRVLLRDPGAATDHGGGRPVFGATVLDVSPPRLRGNGAAVAAERELASWPEIPAAPDLLHRHRLLRAGPASAMGLEDLPPPVAGEWLADPGHWRQLRHLLAVVVAAHAARDPLAPGLAVDAARAELGLADRELVEALTAWPGSSGSGGRIEAVGGYLRSADRGERTSRKTLVVPSSRGSGRTGRIAGQHRSAARPGSAMTWCQGSARLAAAVRNPPGRAFRRR